MKGGRLARSLENLLDPWSTNSPFIAMIRRRRISSMTAEGETSEAHHHSGHAEVTSADSGDVARNILGTAVVSCARHSPVYVSVTFPLLVTSSGLYKSPGRAVINLSKESPPLWDSCHKHGHH